MSACIDVYLMWVILIKWQSGWVVACYLICGDVELNPLSF